jgi:hypothetical protein
MKQIKILLPLFIVIILLNACKSSSSKAQESSASSANPLSGASAAFSCAINGKAITGQGVDEMQLRNTAFYYPDNNHTSYILFELYSTKDGNDPKPGYFFRIKCPAKKGTYVREGDKAFDADAMPDVTLDFLTGDQSRYRISISNKDIATVTITSITKTNITGTFSASMSLSNDTPNGTVKTVSVTDGRFDIPFSTGNIRPE